MRDDFLKPTKELLARRVGVKCSNPSCRKSTSGPQEDSRGSVSIGVASHISAASEGGPRYDAAMTAESRVSADNGIWLCQNCAKLIDNDPLAYSVEILRAWRQLAEAMAKNELERGIHIPADERFSRAERDMPDLLKEMRADLTKSPLARRFACMSNRWVVNTDALRYYFEDHPSLTDKVRILANLGLVRYDKQMGSLVYYIISEPLADYLRVAVDVAGDIDK